MKKALAALVLLVCVLGLVQAAADGRNGYYRFPAIHGEAFLEYLEGKVLPAVDILEKRAKG